MKIIRWTANIFYRTNTGSTDISHNLEEISDLHQIVENGPHWDTIEKIEIFRVNHNENTNLTVEEASKL